MKLATVVLVLFAVGGSASTARAGGDVLFYSGHHGLNQGHTQLAAVYASMGHAFFQSSAATLPNLTPYSMVFISCPGFADSTDDFSPAEVAALDAWLSGVPAGPPPPSRPHIILIGEVGFPLPSGGGVGPLDRLCAALGGDVAFQPANYDTGCFAYGCAAINTTDPLVAGLSGLCKSGTSVWTRGIPVSYPIDDPTQPWVVRGGNPDKCIIGIGDSNTLSDPCGHLSESDTRTFAERLYTLGCLEQPTPTVRTTWGAGKAIYR